MRLLGCLLLAALAVPAAAASDLTFGSPGRLEGSVDVADAVYAVVFFGDAPADLEFTASSALGYNHSETQGQWDGDQYPYTTVTSPRESYDAIRFTARTKPGASLMVVGAIESAAWSHQASEIRALDGACGRTLFSAEERGGLGQRFVRCPAGAMPLIYHGEKAGAGPAPLRLSVTGIQYAEWSGLDIACQSTRCPSGGGEAPATTFPSPADIRLRTFHQQEVAPAEGRLTVQGNASAFILGGRELDVLVDGGVRLPTAATDAGCGCVGPENQTLFARGRIGLQDLQAQPGDRFSATMGGQPTGVQFDETPVDPSLFLRGGAGLAVGAIAATATIGVALKLLLGGLFTRLSKEKALEHPRRQRLFQYIQDHPGANFRELVRQSQIASGTARHHLSVLKRSGHIVEKPHGSTVRFFENHGKFESTWGSVVLLREEPLRLLHEWLAAHPNVPQKAVLEGMETLGWSRSTTQHRLLRLQEGGLVAMRQQGRLKFYTVAVRQPERKVGWIPMPTQAVTGA